MAVKTVQTIINGVTTTLTYNSTSKRYEATITAPSTSSYNNNDGHYYPVTVKATDEAGNTTTKNDTDALITNNKPTITWKVTDDDSGVNSGSIKVTIDTGAAITAGIIKTAVTGGYECTYTPTTALADGSHTIKIDVSDNDGNAATQKTVTFKVDTVPPTLSVTAPVAGLITNKAACTVTGTTNDITSSPVTVTIKLNSGSAEAVTVGADGSFSKSLTLASGNNTITIVATDSAGKSSTVTRTVTLDTTAPTIKSVTLTPNPVDAGKTYVISVEVTD